MIPKNNSFVKINFHHLFTSYLCLVIPAQLFLNKNPIFKLDNSIVQFSLVVSVVVLTLNLYRENLLSFLSFLRNSVFGIGIILWNIGGFFSFIINIRNFPKDIILTYPFSIIIFTLIFFIFFSLKFTDSLFKKNMKLLLIGSSLPMLYGLISYYQIYGIPDAITLLSSRYDGNTFDSYEEATFGNSGATASFLILVVPTFYYFFSKLPSPRISNFILYVLYVIITLNIFIVSSRTLFFTLILMFILNSIYTRSIIKSILLPISFLSLLLFILFGSELVDYFNSLKIFVQSATEFEDHSSTERIDAMIEGLKIFEDNFVFGIGPGMALKKHSFSSSHQFNINQACETGIFGFLGTLLICISIITDFIKCILKKRDSKYKIICLSGAFGYIVYLILANGSIGDVYNWVWIGIFGMLSGTYFNLSEM